MSALAGSLLFSVGMLTTSGRRTSERWANQRGIALPMAMVLLAVLTMLSLAFAVLATTEPVVATNHARTAVARTLADSAIERVAWALSNPTVNPGGIPAAQIPAAAPYDGQTFFALGSQGGFTAQVTAGALATERLVTAIGWAPDNASPGRAHRKIRVTLQQGPIRPLDPPCALCVNGNIQVGGSSIIDARAHGCGTAPPPAAGAMYTGPTLADGGLNPLGGNGRIYGYGDNTANQTTDIAGGAPSASAFTYTPTELAKMKEVAKRNGTYYQGARTTLPAGGGIIYIDTVDGSDFTSSTSDSNAGSLTINSTGTYSGIIIVAGSIRIMGSVTINGLVYALNDTTVTGSSIIEGGLVSENRKDTSSTNIDADNTGNSTVIFNCQNIRDGGGSVSQAWIVKDGTYFEIDDNM